MERNDSVISLSNSTLVTNYNGASGEPRNVCSLGILAMESLEKSIQLWEESLQILKSNNEILPDDEPNTWSMQRLEKILEGAYAVQRLSEEFFLHENSVLYESDHRTNTLRSVSSVESFQSAEDYNLSDSEETLLAGGDATSGKTNWPLYNAALKLVELGTVPYRSVKTELVGCADDTEYVAKLHCLRGAFTRIMHSTDKRDDIRMKGKNVFSAILTKADKDPKDFESTYDSIINWSQDPSNWGALETELKDRGLRALTFYDIVLDFIFLDAFEDLEAPPASCLAVIQNRWLSTSFKETALSTAVWSVLKTKRRWLRSQDGFVARFYDMSEHIMPALAWGFLGPSSPFQELCYFFKDKFTEFLQAIFSFEKVRYTNIDDLCVDILIRLEEMYSVVMDRLNSPI
jgi:hypothetical protein